jgi:potassium-transporting ATPase potassium-binding subunit
MTPVGWLQIALYVAVVLALVRPLGGYMTRVFAGERTWLSPVLAPAERAFYAAAGVKADAEHSWRTYALCVLALNATGFALLYAILRLQGVLPLNPQAFAGLSGHLAFNTAISFVTNTNWQSYAGEATMSHFSQTAGLTVQNFLSAATGMAVALAFIRGFTRARADTLGNFWTDLTRAILYILLPGSILIAIALMALGMPQTLAASAQATTLEGASQTIALGPVASQVAIKMLGTNGGGFFNANAAHPFENTDAISNFIQMVAIFAIGAAFTNVFGRMAKDERQGWAILGAMGVLFLAFVAIVYWQESQPTGAMMAAGIDGPNMEGKETRFGVAISALFAVITTAASCGAVNAMHDSFTPLGGMIPMFQIQLGEVIVGGVGAGLYGMFLFVILAIFVAGLMVGRTPEYVGKKIEAREMKLAVLGILAPSAMILGFTALMSAWPEGRTLLADGATGAGPSNAGPHGFSQMLYAFSSAAGNNGSAFAGLTANSPAWNVALAIAMLVGRFAVIVPCLAIAGALAAKPVIPTSAGTFPTTGPLFVGLLVGVILIMGGLTFFPALALGPLTEQVAMLRGQLF